MARWKLMTPHHLNLVDPTEWEYSEASRDGKTKRLKLKVPRYLDPRDPSDWNNVWGPTGATEGEVIVALPGKGHPRDYEFLGDPTPDMIPIDDEAREVSASFEHRWAYKPENNDTSYSQSMIDKFQIEMAAKSAAPTEVTIPGLEGLVGAIAKQTEFFSTLIANQSQTPAVPTIRR